MYLLYLDDSGSPDNKNEQYFVLGGICLPETSVRWLSHQIETIAEKYSLGNPNQVEFHAAEIFRGKIPPWDKIKDKKDRVKIIQEVLCVLQSAYSETVLFAYVIHKKSFSGEDPVIKAYENLASRFNTYLENRSNSSPNKGLIILDKSSYETGLQNLALEIRHSGNRWGQQLRNIVEVPLFVDSTASRIIQFADHVAYAVFRRYEASDLTYFNCIENRFFQDQGVIHGLVHRQTVNINCTCPACLSRQKHE